MGSTPAATALASGHPQGLRVRWFDAWHSDLDDALAALPEMETCPHDLLRALMRHRTAARKRTALVTEGGEPVAVIGLRKKHHHWLPVGDLAVPYAIAPALPGRLFDAFRSLGIYARIPDWKYDAAGSEQAAEREVFDAFRVSTHSDWDTLWRALRNHDRVRKARNRCRRLGGIDFEVDAPGAAPWLINRWEETWRGPGWDMSDEAADIRVAIDYFEAHGTLRTFRLLHAGRPVAGTIWLAHGKTLIAHTSWWDRAYGRYGVGVHLDELFFRWTTHSGYDEVDLGGEFDFKAKWALPAATHMNLVFLPLHLRAARGAARVLRRGRDVIRRASPAAGALAVTAAEPADRALQLPF